MCSPRSRRKHLTLRGQSWGESPSAAWSSQTQNHLGSGIRWRSGKQEHVFNWANAMVIFAGIIVQMLFAVRRHFEADASYHLSTWLPRNEATPSSASQESAICRGPGTETWEPDHRKAKILLLAGEVGFWSGCGRTCISRLQRTHVNSLLPGQPCVPTERGSEALGVKWPSLMNPELESEVSSGVMKRLENKGHGNQQTRKSSWDAWDKGVCFYLSIFDSPCLLGSFIYPSGYFFFQSSWQNRYVASQGFPSAWFVQYQMEK